MPKEKFLTDEYAALFQAVGERLKEKRLERRETVHKAAKGIGISSVVLRRIEFGASDFWLLTIYHICVYYEMGLGELIDWASKKKRYWTWSFACAFRVYREFLRFLQHK